MVGKVLTIIPMLVLSGLFFAAGIVEGGVLFLAFALMMASALLRAGGAAQGPDDAGGAGPGEPHG
jgi:hypothetical protein